MTEPNLGDFGFGYGRFSTLNYGFGMNIVFNLLHSCLGYFNFILIKYKN